MVGARQFLYHCKEDGHGQHDLFQLKTDTDVFNDTVDEKRHQFELGLNFENDIAEREEIERMQNRRKDVA